jgi:hypothetical protein
MLRFAAFRRHMGGMRRDIEVTSYAEIVLGSGAADQAHPAFSKLAFRLSTSLSSTPPHEKRSPDDRTSGPPIRRG